MPANAETIARDIRRAAIHEGAHAILAIQDGKHVQIRILPADTGRGDPELSSVIAQCLYSSGARPVGKIRHAAFGLAGFCAEHISDQCMGDFSAGSDDIAYWTDEILGLLEEGVVMSATDQNAWLALRKGDRRRAVKIAVIAILNGWPEIERIVSAVQTHFKARGHAIFSWPLGEALVGDAFADHEVR